MAGIVHFTAIHSPKLLFFNPVGFFSSRSQNLFPVSSQPTATSNSGIRLKSTPSSSSSSSMAAQFQVSESASSEELELSSSRSIGEHDLLIVGPGVLGRLVAEKWREEHPGCQIFGQTVTTNHHDELIQLGINPSLKWTEATHKFPYVIFCAPPYQSADYPGDLRRASLSWDGEGSFLFTSSSAPYDCDDNGECNEDTPVVPIGRSPRTDVLLKAENVVLEFGGCVLRLSALYKNGRGAHAYWLEKGVVDARPDHILNFIHYEKIIPCYDNKMLNCMFHPLLWQRRFQDAASLSIAILKKKLKRRIFLGCDNHPLSRQEVMDLVNQSGKFEKKFEKFTSSDGPLGKRLDNSKTRQEIGWEPKYSSFAFFLDTI